MERISIEELGISGYELMQRAGYAVFQRIQASHFEFRSLLILCGGGHNGGDGYVVARLALVAGYEVTLCALVAVKKLTGDAKKAAEDWMSAGGQISDWRSDIVSGHYDCIIDAILGTGLQRPLEGYFDEVVTIVNNSAIPVIAVDIPSGLQADSGLTMGAAIYADQTITFIGVKQGLLSGQARDYVGCLYFDDLGLPQSAFQRLRPAGFCISDHLRHEYLPRRSRMMHKGHCGHVLLIGGERGMSGAIGIAAIAALRVGAGLVSVATREHAAALNTVQPELMCHPVDSVRDLEPLLKKANVIAIGPGLGQGKWGRSLLGAVLTAPQILLVDADALNMLAEEPYQRDQWVMTPHPGEAARLLGISTESLENNRHVALLNLKAQYGAVIVLKGAASLVSGPQKDADVFLCDRGNPGMASGGMGDVLTGVIVGLIAQGLPIDIAARLGVYLHASAADAATTEMGERGLLATDLYPYLHRLVNPG